MLRLLPNIEGFGGIPGPEAYQNKKWIRPTSTLAPYKFTSKKEKFSWLERLYQTPKEMKASLSKSTSFQIHSSKCSFKTAFFQTSIFKFYLLSPISALLLPTCSTSSFQKLVEKVRNYIKEVWLIFKKWFWLVDFERFFFFKKQKKSVLSRKMR